MTLPPMIVSGNRDADVKAVSKDMCRFKPEKFGDLLPNDIPHDATRRNEEDFIRRFFTEEDIYIRGGAFGEGKGFRFLKQVLWSIATYNHEQRIPAIAEEWLASNMSIWTDPENIPYLMRSDVAPMTFFHEDQVAMYSDKLLRRVIRHIQYKIKCHAVKYRILCAPLPTMEADDMGFPKPGQNYKQTSLYDQMPPAALETLPYGTTQPGGAMHAPQSDRTDTTSTIEAAARDIISVQSMQGDEQVEQRATPSLQTIPEQLSHQPHETDSQKVGKAHSRGLNRVNSQASALFNRQVIQQAYFQPQGHAYPLNRGQANPQAYVPPYKHPYGPPQVQPHEPPYQHYGPVSWQTNGYSPPVYASSDQQLIYVAENTRVLSNEKERPNILGNSKKHATTETVNSERASPVQTEPSLVQKEMSPVQKVQPLAQQAPPHSAQQEPVGRDVGLPQPTVSSSNKETRMINDPVSGEDQYPSSRKATPLSSDKAGSSQPTQAEQSSRVQTSSETDASVTESRMNKETAQPPAVAVADVGTGPAYQLAEQVQTKSADIDKVKTTQESRVKAKARDSKQIDKGRIDPKSKATITPPSQPKDEEARANLDCRVGTTHIGEGATEVEELFLFRMTHKISAAEALKLLRDTYSGVEDVFRISLSQKTRVYKIIMSGTSHARQLLDENRALPAHRRLAIEVPHKYHTSHRRSWDHAPFGQSTGSSTLRSSQDSHRPSKRGSRRKSKKSLSQNYDAKLDVTKPWEPAKAKAQSKEHLQGPKIDQHRNEVLKTGPPALKDDNPDVAPKASGRLAYRTFAEAVASGRESSVARKAQPAANDTKGIANKPATTVTPLITKQLETAKRKSAVRDIEANVPIHTAFAVSPAAIRGKGGTMELSASKTDLSRTRGSLPAKDESVAEYTKKTAKNLLTGAFDVVKTSTVSTDATEANDMIKGASEPGVSCQAFGHMLAELEDKPNEFCGSIGIPEKKSKSWFEEMKGATEMTKATALKAETAQHIDKEEDLAEAELHQPIYSRKRKKDKNYKNSDSANESWPSEI
ncbi:hypothetical protein K470DRAFT_266193 [Piedraia hortae CBS 480.64]|uniref:Uncharacterized protein n=1 Tax=Piedraia hortae CBS 480.64 TaxID=1314780 RepID=A0A6A7BSY4_9PEZI|nr:hypothetical protein K470DRAFT_266193 [Piedraia hortae CBS 480.64]